MKRERNSEETRAALISAAETIVTRDGVGKMTLEAVAREAGVSKGALLYHFNSKEALIIAMIKQTMAVFEDYVRRHAEKEGKAPGQLTRAHARVNLDDTADVPKEFGRKIVSLSAGLLAAIAEYPNLVKMYGEEFQSFRRELSNDGINPTRALIIALAADAIWLYESLGVWTPTAKDRKEILTEMLRMTREK